MLTSTHHGKSRLFVIALLLACAFPIAALVQAPIAPSQPAAPAPLASSAPTPVAGASPLSPTDIEPFLDGLLPAQLDRENIAGAVVIVVKDGQVLFTKGYGYADVAKRAPVTPDTLFRPGSISKLFTWTAVMQQAEQGKLDLDRDVNEYIDFKIPQTFGKPITLRHIMTHTAGFEETAQELFVPDAARMRSLEKYVKAHLPNRIFPPATTPAYSNYATALAGYILQRVSGQSFDDYIEGHILKPLGMNHSTCRQPLPAALQPLMSQGYLVASSPARPFEFVMASPAGSSSIPATDMAHFMIAHLQNGEYHGVRILREDTAKLMHARQFVNVPELNAMALGFYEENRNGLRIIGHAGDTGAFHSDFHLVPEIGLGFFVSYNSAGKGEVSGRTLLWQAFLDRYLPTPRAKTPAVRTTSRVSDTTPATPADIDALVGPYDVSRRADTTLMRFTRMLGQMNVVRNPDGTISVDMLKEASGVPKKFAPISRTVFREVNGQDLLGFKYEPVTNRFVMAIDYPFMVFQKPRWYESAALGRNVMIGSIVVFGLTLAFWPLGAGLRWHYGRKVETAPDQRRLRLIVRAVAACGLIFLAGLFGFFTIASKDIALFSPHFNVWLRLIQLFGWLAVAGTIAAIYYLVRHWRERGVWLWTKVAYTAGVVACVGFAWLLFAWNGLVLNLKY